MRACSAEKKARRAALNFFKTHLETLILDYAAFQKTAIYLCLSVSGALLSLLIAFVVLNPNNNAVALCNLCAI